MITRYDIDLGKCMYCGLCVEACPTCSLTFTTAFEGACFTYSELVKKFIPAGVKVQPYRPAKQATTNL